MAAADSWADTTSALFADAPFHLPDDPLALVPNFEAARQVRAIDANCTAQNLARESVDHLHRNIELLFDTKESS